jgi:hypothetical protein
VRVSSIFVFVPVPESAFNALITPRWKSTEPDRPSCTAACRHKLFASDRANAVSPWSVRATLLGRAKF